VAQAWFYAEKFGEGIMSRGHEIGIVSRGTGRPCDTAGRLGTAIGTGNVIGARTVAGGQCADAIKTGVGADGLARILHGYGKRGPWAGEKRNATAAYVMPDWTLTLL